MRIGYVLIFLTFALATEAQETYSLQRAVQLARQNNLNLKLAQNGLELARIDTRQADRAWHPNVSGSANLGVQFGRTIDPTTNEFNNQTIGFNSFGLNVGATVYAGGSIRNNQRQARLNEQATEADIQAQENNIAIDVAQAYLQVLLNEEQLANARQRFSLTQAQLEQTEKLIRAGALPANDSLDILAQLALDQQSIVTSENAIQLALVTLKQLMDVDPGASIRLERVDITDEIADANAALASFEEIYIAALNTQPQIRAGELSQEAATVGVDLARAGFLPTVSVFGGLSTNWSSGFKDFANPDTSNLEIVQGDPRPVIIGGIPTTLSQFEIEGLTFNNLGYFNQLNQNFGQNVGLAVQIPIYSRGNTRFSVERAELNARRQLIQNEQIKQLLKADIQRALADARAAQRSLIASRRAVTAAQASFQNAQRQYDLGVINTLVFAQARNALDQAEINLTSARYQYVFSKKILDFYVGRPIRLEN